MLHAADVVVVPVGQQHGFDRAFLVLQDLGQGVAPFGLAFGRVDEDPRGARAEEVGVCALEGEFAGVVAEDADGGGGDAGYWGEGGEGGGHFCGVVGGFDGVVGCWGGVMACLELEKRRSVELCCEESC